MTLTDTPFGFASDESCDKFFDLNPFVIRCVLNCDFKKCCKAYKKKGKHCKKCPKKD